MKRILTGIEREGQPYIDEPVMALVSNASPLALAVNTAVLTLATPGKQAPRGPRIRPRVEELDHYKRTPLRWVKPDGAGGFVPKRVRP